MKNLLTIVICLGLFGLKAQNASTFKMKPNGQDVTVEIKNLSSDIKIEGTDLPEIVIESSGYKGIPEKAKGLKPLSAYGEENTNIGLYVKQEGNIVIIAAASGSANDADYLLKLPKNLKLKVDYKSFQSGDVEVSNMANEVEVQSQIAEVKLINVTGPIVAHSLSADILVIFTQLNQNSPTSISSTSGDIDITLPAVTKGNFKMSSTSGEVYTDMNFEFGEEKELNRWGGGMSANATLNGGGVEVALRCISGDIYVRKAN